MSKLIITRGLPASGKTTWAKKWVDEAPNRARVNRDDLRFATFVKPTYQQDQESIITSIEKQAVHKLLKDGYDVVVDATNLRPKYIKDWATVAYEHGAEVEIMDFPITFVESVTRDSRRENKVGQEVIQRMYDNYTNQGEFLPVDLSTRTESFQVTPYIPNLNKPKAIIVDIDGTLAINNSDRSPYDWTRVKEDSVNYPIASIVAKFEPYNSIIICSGREEICRNDTVDWLLDNKIRFDQLYMRKEGDYRKDWLIKYEIFDQHIRNNYRVQFVLDDRKQVIRMWQKLGLTTLCCLQDIDADF